MHIAILKSQMDTGFLIMMGLILVVFYIFILLPQKKKRKKQEEERNNVQKGDKIITIGGIHGKVEKVAETNVVIIVEDGTKIRVDKTAITIDGSEKIVEEGKK